MSFFIAIAVFLITYAIIISEKINRAVIALAGAAVTILQVSSISMTLFHIILIGERSLYLSE